MTDSTPTRRLLAASGLVLLSLGLRPLSAQAQSPAPNAAASPETRMEAITRQNKQNGETRAKSDAARDARLNRATGSICVGCGGTGSSPQRQKKAATNKTTGAPKALPSELAVAGGAN